MAKHKVVHEVSMPATEQYKPRLYLDLQDQDVSQVKGLVIDEEVELVVTGKVVGLSQRKRAVEKKAVKTGSIELEGYRVRVMGEEKNEFTKLMEDD